MAGTSSPLVRLLGACRFLLVVPVIGCLLLTAGVVIMGMARLLTAGFELLRKGDVSAKAAKTMSLAVIEIIDLFLVGTVAYITGVGLYKLFVARADVELPVRLKINTLQDLENKIFGVIVAALAVAFLGHAASAERPEALLNYGGGIALVIVALAFFMRSGDKKDTSGS